jgi:outer membrane lipoprotein SlyB
MEVQSPRSAHPMIITAAVAVTVFSGVGVAAVMGWIPTSSSQQAAPAPIVAATPQIAAPAEPAAPVKPVEAAPEHRKPVAKHKTEPLPPGPLSSIPPPSPAQVAAAEQAKPICRECGVVESVRGVEKAGEGSGAGAVGGGVLGGILGHQMGSGRGNTAMTVLGAVGGAVAGNQIEKQSKKTTSYQITVRFVDGTTRLITQSAQPSWHTGDKVKVIDGVISSNANG